MFHSFEHDDERAAIEEYWEAHDMSLLRRVLPSDSVAVKIVHDAGVDGLPFDPIEASDAADAWAFGCLVFQVLTGEELIPTVEESKSQDIHPDHLGFVVTYDADKLDARLQLVKNRRFVRLLKKLLTMNPEDRPPMWTVLRDPCFSGLTLHRRWPQKTDSFDFESVTHLGHCYRESYHGDTAAGEIRQCSYRGDTAAEESRREKRRIAENMAEESRREKRRIAENMAEESRREKRRIAEKMASKRATQLPLRNAMVQVKEFALPVSFIVLPVQIGADAVNKTTIEEYVLKFIFSLGRRFKNAFEDPDAMAVRLKQVIGARPMYFYLIDEATHLPVTERGYPIELTGDTNEYAKCMVFIQDGFHVIKNANNLVRLFQMLGMPSLDNDLVRKVEATIDSMTCTSACLEKSLKTPPNASDLEDKVSRVYEGAFHCLEMLFAKHDVEKSFAGLVRKIDPSTGNAIWTKVEPQDQRVEATIDSMTCTSACLEKSLKTAPNASDLEDKVSRVYEGAFHCPEMLFAKHDVEKSFSGLVRKIDPSTGNAIWTKVEPQDQRVEATIDSMTCTSACLENTKGLDGEDRSGNDDQVRGGEPGVVVTKKDEDPVLKDLVEALVFNMERHVEETGEETREDAARRGGVECRVAGRVHPRADADGNKGGMGDCVPELGDEERDGVVALAPGDGRCGVEPEADAIFLDANHLAAHMRGEETNRIASRGLIF
ncbi:Aste57867_24989 [Aphanomyces stellatus]|uniref:Aste57867_24989 protein n=1 Tax=Aphanomyces stellatus TaxID=120398 RepID=A0A485LRY8_9STRA|nr:hypothetical protein As57867_024911 [Aphanomyces stellatus]VFU01620.1 Aste57867_24989 [Aphanomyces stellatus]